MRLLVLEIIDNLQHSVLRLCNMKITSSLVLLSIFFIFCSAAPVYQIEGVEERKADNTEPNKSKLVAFLLSFFVGGFGADWFYLSNGVFTYIMVGIIKLLLIGQAGLCCCSVKFGFCSLQEGLEKICGPCSCLVSLGVFLWWVVDWVRVITNTFPDGNGMELLLDM